MSVIVTGMDMPENCLECMFKSYDEYEDDHYCPFTDITCLSIGRQDNCPLKSVDGLIEEIQRMPNDNSSYWNHCDVVDRKDLVKIIKEYCEMEE